MITGQESIDSVLHAMDAARVPANAAECDAFIRPWEREAVMCSSALLVECNGAGPLEPAQDASLSLILERARGWDGS